MAAAQVRGGCARMQLAAQARTRGSYAYTSEKREPAPRALSRGFRLLYRLLYGALVTALVYVLVIANVQSKVY